MVGYIDGNDALLTRLRRVEGQVRGLQRMVEPDTYCIDVLTQVAAAAKASQAVALESLTDHLRIAWPTPPAKAVTSPRSSSRRPQPRSPASSGPDHHQPSGERT